MMISQSSISTLLLFFISCSHYSTTLVQGRLGDNHNNDNNLVQDHNIRNLASSSCALITDKNECKRQTPCTWMNGRRDKGRCANTRKQTRDRGRPQTLSTDGQTATMVCEGIDTKFRCNRAGELCIWDRSGDNPVCRKKTSPTEATGASASDGRVNDEKKPSLINGPPSKEESSPEATECNGVTKRSECARQAHCEWNRNKICVHKPVGGGTAGNVDNTTSDLVTNPSSKPKPIAANCPVEDVNIFYIGTTEEQCGNPKPCRDGYEFWKKDSCGCGCEKVLVLDNTEPSEAVNCTYLWSDENYISKDGSDENCSRMKYVCEAGYVPLFTEGCGCGCMLDETKPSETSICTSLWGDENYILMYKSDDDCSSINYKCKAGYIPSFTEGCGCGCMFDDTNTDIEDPDPVVIQPGPLPNPQPGPEPSTGTTGCPKSTSICMTLYEPKICTNEKIADSKECFYSNLCVATGGTGYQDDDCTSAGPMDVNISVISPDAVVPVEQETASNQVEAALTMLADSAIQRNTGTSGYTDAALGGVIFPMRTENDMVSIMDGDMVFAMEDSIALDAPIMMASTIESAPAAATVDVTDAVSDYATNTQEANVDESDGAKSDGTHVYAAYGDEIKVWDTAGNNLQTFALPPTDDGSDTSNTDTSTTTTTSEFAEPMPAMMDAMIMPMCVKPTVQSLMLTSNHLVAFVSGYRDIVIQQNSIEGYPILTGYGQTRVIVYDKTDVANAGLKLLAHRDVHGTFQSARMVGETIHAVTVSYIQTYYDLLQHLERYTYPLYKGMNETAYQEAAAKYASEEVIPTFTSKLFGEICGTSFDCPETFLPPIMWQDDVSGANDAMMWKEGIMDSYVSISSLNMATFDEQIISDSTGTPTFNLSIAASFFPAGGVKTYASEDVMALAGQGYHFDATRNMQLQQTYLLGFKLNNTEASTKFHAYGSLPGYLLNQFSLDHEDGYLRVATTIRNWWRMPLDGSTVLIEEVPPMTENYVSVLKLEGGLWDIVGQTDSLGKEGETITAVRFFQKIAYVVTFRQTDPFYVIDLSNPEEETIPVLGELNITGFSQYMHPLNADASMLLALGQEADDTGRVLGLSLTIFNATNPTEPTALHRLVVENRTDAHSSSSAQWDHKAFRYFDVPGLVDADGYLIIPMTTYDWHAYEHFDGYKVYEISIDNGITEKHNITHVESSAWNYCYSRSILPERSFVFNGDVMTLKRHSVRITDLGTGDQTGEIDFVASQTTSCTGCYGYWLY